MAPESTIHLSTLMTAESDRTPISKLVLNGFHSIDPEGELVGYTSGLSIDIGQHRTKFKVAPSVSFNSNPISQMTDMGQIYDVIVCVSKLNDTNPISEDCITWIKWEDVTGLSLPISVVITSSLSFGDLNSNFQTEVKIFISDINQTFTVIPTALGSFMIRRVINSSEITV